MEVTPASEIFRIKNRQQKDIQLVFKQSFQDNFSSAKNAKKNEQERFASGIANTKPKTRLKMLSVPCCQNYSKTATAML